VVEAALGQDELDRLEGAGAIVLTVLVVAVVLGGLLALGGVAALVTFAVLAAMGRTAGIARQDGQWSHVYAEMFAVWLGGYMLFARLPRAVFTWWREHGHATPSMDLQLVASVAATVVAAAVALWWGTRRGLPLRSIMSGVGLRAFTFRDVLWGVVCWSMGLALLLVGLVIAMLLSALFADGHLHASHPIQQMVEDSGALGLLMTYVLACVSAPIFEELFFRGAMYRNLRQGLGRWGSLGGAVLSAAISSFIFAAIHPQGLIFVPVLGGLAVAFCIMREWRGTINASIVAHAINNTAVLTLNVLMLRH
jgi:membrane protease YdiL (CAAX protease family)